MNLFQCGEFKLNSGATSKWKIECDVLNDMDIETLAYMASLILPPFGLVVGVPTGGLRFADALRVYSTEGPTLVADDVLTTGGSMEKVRTKISNPRDFYSVYGIVIFARGQCPYWVRSIFQLPQQLWIKR